MFAFLVLSIALPFVCHAASVMPGGTVEVTVPPNDEKTVFALDAINEYYAKKGDNAERSLTHIIKVTSQVVQGTMYTFTLDITSDAVAREICTVKVWAKTWIDPPYTVQSVVCKANNLLGGDDHDYVTHGYNKRQVGTPEVVDWEDAEVQGALKALVDQHNMGSNNLYRVLFSKGTVTKQVVSGYLYKFSNMGQLETTCMNNDVSSFGKVSFDECPIKADSPINDSNAVCSGEVLFQSWMSPQYTVQKVQCVA